MGVSALFFGRVDPLTVFVSHDNELMYDDRFVSLDCGPRLCFVDYHIVLGNTGEEAHELVEIDLSHVPAYLNPRVRIQGVTAADAQQASADVSWEATDGSLFAYIEDMEPGTYVRLEYFEKDMYLADAKRLERGAIEVYAESATLINADPRATAFVRFLAVVF